LEVGAAPISQNKTKKKKKKPSKRKPASREARAGRARELGTSRRKAETQSKRGRRGKQSERLAGQPRIKKSDREASSWGKHFAHLEDGQRKLTGNGCESPQNN